MLFSHASGNFAPNDSKVKNSTALMSALNDLGNFFYGRKFLEKFWRGRPPNSPSASIVKSSLLYPGTLKPKNGKKTRRRSSTWKAYKLERTFILK